MLLTDLKNNRHYTAQITPYEGKVCAEIVYRADCFYDPSVRLWHTAMYKYFGSRWNSAPLEKDYEEAHKWVESQLKKLEQYGTPVVTKPEFLVRPKDL